MAQMKSDWPLSRVQLWAFFATFVIYTLYFGLAFITPTDRWYYLTSDEPHYLVMAQSLIQDGDLALENNYAQRTYWSFYPNDLGDIAEPSQVHAIAGRDGHLYSKHSVGLSILVLPAFWLGGHVAANLLLILIGSLVSTIVLSACYEWTGNWPASLAAWLLVSFCAPLLRFAPMLVPETAGGLCAIYTIRQATKPAPKTAEVILAGICLAAISWLHLRYLPLLAPLIVFLFVTRHPQARTWIGLLGLSVAGVLTYYLALYGGLPPVEEWGRFSASTSPAGALGLWLDRQWGLVPFAPAFIMAPVGLLLAFRGAGPSRPWSVLVAATVLLYWAFLSPFEYWNGGWNPPARMLVPVLPLLAPPVAVVLMRLRHMWAWVLLLGIPGWGAAMIFLLLPQLRFTEPTGQSEFWLWLGNRVGLDLQAWLPSLILARPSDYVVSILWLLGVLAVSWLLWSEANRKSPLTTT
jgi:hypothetical protein